MATTPVLSPATIDSLIQRGRDEYDKIDGLANLLTDRVNRALDLADWLTLGFADFETSAIRAILADIWKVIRAIGVEIGHFFVEPGVPWTLYYRGQDWTNQVGARASALVAESTADGVRADDHWQGAAASAYLNTLPRQAAALSAVKVACDTIDTALIAIALAIVVMWVALVAAIVAFVIELTIEAGAAATGVGAPAAAAGAGLSVAKAAIIIGGVVTTFLGYATVIYTQCASLNESLTNNTAFPLGHWPAPSIDLSDGSLSDGDDTDWHIKA